MAEITDSWAQIQQAASLGVHTTRYQLGDTKTFTHETYGEVVMQIVAFDADDKADGSGKAAISWVSRDIITDHVMNDTPTNEGGWGSSKMRSWLRSDFYNAMPGDVKAAIVEVNKTYYELYTKTTNCIDSVWIPSAREIWGKQHDIYGYELSGAEYTAFFSSDAARVKYNSSGDSKWWLRTAFMHNYTTFRVTYAFDDTKFDADNSLGVVLGFCTDASDIVPTPIDPTSLLMGYRVGQMIRGMRNA